MCDGLVALTTALEQGFTLACGGRGKETGTNETTPVTQQPMPPCVLCPKSSVSQCALGQCPDSI